jgi:hypothetical protein
VSEVTPVRAAFLANERTSEERGEREGRERERDRERGRLGYLKSTNVLKQAVHDA